MQNRSVLEPYQQTRWIILHILACHLSGIADFLKTLLVCSTGLISASSANSYTYGRCLLVVEPKRQSVFAIYIMSWLFSAA